ncbi:MAG: PAS domain-containing sensor histidine kinase [Alphaproteobacteria bacterium]
MASTTDFSALDFSKARRWRRWANRVGLARKLAYGLAAAVIACGLATYALWSDSIPIGGSPDEVLALLIVDLVLLLSLGTLIARQLAQLWANRQSGGIGSRLHLRMVAWFSALAVAPAIVTAVFSAVFFHFGVQSWFSDSVRTAVEESVAVAEAYVDEHRNAIRADVLAMAADLNRLAPQLIQRPPLFNQVLTAQAALRSLSEATVFDSSGRILARTTLSLAAAFETVPVNALDEAQGGDVVIFTTGTEDQVQALVRLDQMLDSYLYVGRFVDQTVLNHVRQTRQAAAQYRQLEGARSSIQLTSAAIFIIVAMMLLLAAVWLGLNFANRLVRPIGDLANVADRVRQGDFGARVPVRGQSDELGMLARTFNRMTRQLDHQRSELIEANKKMDRRRRFTEAVLSGVSAGVIGVDGEGRISFPNSSAARLLRTEMTDLVGQPLALVIPEMADLLAEAKARPGRTAEGQVDLERNDRRHALLVRVSADRGRDGAQQGYVVTFDDVTELVAAQRTAAWADVARRIAHEIKNPLTPIQLSAERLKRRYLKQIEEDPQTFLRCTDTIIRQVGDIGRMVDEFSAFARMPAPAMQTVDIVEVLRQALFAQQIANGGISYEAALPTAPVWLSGDPRQLGQVFTNLLKNAAEAIEGKPENTDASKPEGAIAVTVEERESEVVISIADDGRGLPMELSDRLTEPYVTTRSKGTGLGLAIVRKIVDDHGGKLRLENGAKGGAVAILTLALPAVASMEATRGG